MTSAPGNDGACRSLYSDGLLLATGGTLLYGGLHFLEGLQLNALSQVEASQPLHPRTAISYARRTIRNPFLRPELRLHAWSKETGVSLASLDRHASVRAYSLMRLHRFARATTVGLSATALAYLAVNGYKEKESLYRQELLNGILPLQISSQNLLQSGNGGGERLVMSVTPEPVSQLSPIVLPGGRVVKPLQISESRITSSLVGEPKRPFFLHQSIAANRLDSQIEKTFQRKLSSSWLSKSTASSPLPSNSRHGVIITSTTLDAASTLPNTANSLALEFAEHFRQWKELHLHDTFAVDMVSVHSSPCSIQLQNQLTEEQTHWVDNLIHKFLHNEEIDGKKIYSPLVKEVLNDPSAREILYATLGNWKQQNAHLPPALLFPGANSPMCGLEGKITLHSHSIHSLSGISLQLLQCLSAVAKPPAISATSESSEELPLQSTEPSKWSLAMASTVDAFWTSATSASDAVMNSLSSASPYLDSIGEACMSLPGMNRVTSYLETYNTPQTVDENPIEEKTVEEKPIKIEEVSQLLREQLHLRFDVSMDFSRSPTDWLLGDLFGLESWLPLTMEKSPMVHSMTALRLLFSGLGFSVDTIAPDHHPEVDLLWWISQAAKAVDKDLWIFRNLLGSTSTLNSKNEFVNKDVNKIEVIITAATSKRTLRTRVQELSARYPDSIICPIYLPNVMEGDGLIVREFSSVESQRWLFNGNYLDAKQVTNELLALAIQNLHSSSPKLSTGEQ